MEPRLTAVMYHYVRDVERTVFPGIKGLSVGGFSRQLTALAERFEMASLESALAFFSGGYRPQRPLCVLTFDDGLKEHAAIVTPMLAERGIQGLFFVPTAGIDESRVLAVHKNHFLMAALDFDEYRAAVLDQVRRLAPETPMAVDPSVARAAYRWDEPDVAQFKHLLNFVLTDAIREAVLDALFLVFLGDEARFARELYVSWDDARAMQDAGMIVGGHSHGHTALATLDAARRRQDLETCTALLRQKLKPQALWPFSYPYGKRRSYGDGTPQMVRDLGYCCAFATEVGENAVGCDVFELRRLDTKDVPG
jgi:peptidoglycan/xylan/chitin deacetylase (PgdA/CDA1 family)